MGIGAKQAALLVTEAEGKARFLLVPVHLCTGATPGPAYGRASGIMKRIFAMPRAPSRR